MLSGNIFAVNVKAFLRLCVHVDQAAVCQGMSHLRTTKLQRHTAIPKITVTCHSVWICHLFICIHRNQTQTRLRWQRSYPPPTTVLLSLWHYRGTRSVHVFTVRMFQIVLTGFETRHLISQVVWNPHQLGRSCLVTGSTWLQYRQYCKTFIIFHFHLWLDLSKVTIPLQSLVSDNLRTYYNLPFFWMNAEF